MNIIYTVCNRTSLPHAIALAESVAQHQPGDEFFIGWVDSAPIPELPANCQVLDIHSLRIPSWNEMLKNYFDFELLAACRPWFAKYIFENMVDCQRLTFLAPTVLLMQSFETLVGMHRDIILTPHIIKPLPKSSALLDRRILNIGMFNSNSWTMKRCAQTIEFINWWCIRTIDRAKYNLCEGMCMDQLWLNFAPVRIYNWSKASAGNWHYGLHSISNYRMEMKNGAYTVENAPLLSVDFTGLLMFDPIWSDYSSLTSQDSIFLKLLKEYRKKVYQIESQYNIKGTPGYGVVPEISSMRTVRNKWATQLKKVTSFIDQIQF